MTKKGEKERKREVQKFENLEDKRKSFGTIKSIFDNFSKVIFNKAYLEIVDTSFNCQNKILYIKTLMHI